MTFRGKPIDKIRTPRSGLQYSEAYARCAASRWAGFRTVEEFADLDDDTQARLIAEYETAMQIQAVLALAHNERMQQQKP